MKIALVNPPWSFDGSIYFGCREPHLPLEYGYAQALLTAAGHDAGVFDAQAEGTDDSVLATRVADFAPDMIVVTTAPSYLFWRCAPPELRIPQEVVRALQPIGGTMVAVGPHGSTTPRTTLRKLRVDVVILGECEDILPQLVKPWSQVQSICYLVNGNPWVQGGANSTDMGSLPALRWCADMLRSHRHHHHRFDAAPSRPGAEMETS